MIFCCYQIPKVSLIQSWLFLFLFLFIMTSADQTSNFIIMCHSRLLLRVLHYSDRVLLSNDFISSLFPFFHYDFSLHCIFYTSCWRAYFLSYYFFCFLCMPTPSVSCRFYSSYVSIWTLVCLHLFLMFSNCYILPDILALLAVYLQLKIENFIQFRIR